MFQGWSSLQSMNYCSLQIGLGNGHITKYKTCELHSYSMRMDSPDGSWDRDRVGLTRKPICFLGVESRFSMHLHIKYVIYNWYLHCEVSIQKLSSLYIHK